MYASIYGFRRSFYYLFEDLDSMMNVNDSAFIRGISNRNGSVDIFHARSE